MNEQEATAFVIREIAKHHSRSDIVMALCQRMGFDWQEAEQFIKNVEAHHGRSVAARQSPFLVLVSLVILIGGIYLAARGVLFFLDFSAMDATTRLLSLRTSYIMGGSLLTGLGFIAGSIIGLWKTVAALL
jgi:hypothetical protein